MTSPSEESSTALDHVPFMADSLQDEKAKVYMRLVVNELVVDLLSVFDHFVSFVVSARS